MAFDFLKKIFGQGNNNSAETKSAPSQTMVSDSVLDRFLIHAKEIFYIDHDTNTLIFALKDGKMTVNNSQLEKASPAMVLLLWLQDIARDNHGLYLSIIERFTSDEPEPSEEAMRDYLWPRFRTGNNAPLAQLRQFYKRGKSIMNFLVHMSSSTGVNILEEISDDEAHDLAIRYGESRNIPSLSGISNSTLAKIILKDLKEGKINQRNTVANEKVIQSNESRKKKAYLLLFSADWCGPSRKFKQEIIQGGITNFSYIDVDKESDLAEKYRIRSVPTTILVDTTGNIIKQWDGYDDEDPGQSQFIKYIRTCGYNISLYPGIKPYEHIPQKAKSEGAVSKSAPKQVSRPMLGSPLDSDVNEAISAFEAGNIETMQNALYHLISKLNKPGSGKLITQYPHKDRLCECFSLCLRYDWMNDSDIREVWAENGFYCIISYLTNDAKTPQDKVAGGLDLFLHVLYGRESLTPKLQDILYKAQMRNEPSFDSLDYSKGCNYVINQFLYLGGSLVQPYAQQALSGKIYGVYEKIMANPALSSIPHSRISLKAQFVSRIIESILNDL